MTAATGIEPEFTETGSGEAAIAALVNGDIDMAKVSFSDTINAIAQGADVCMILPANQTVDLILVSQPEIRTLADLRGRKITLGQRGAEPQLNRAAADAGGGGVERGRLRDRIPRGLPEPGGGAPEWADRGRDPGVGRSGAGQGGWRRAQHPRRPRLSLAQPRQLISGPL